MAIYLDNTVVTKQKLFEELGIAANAIPFPRSKRFQFPVKVDADGNTRHLHRLMCNEYSVYLPKQNREVRLRFANSQKKDKDGNFEYFPTDNALDSGERGQVSVNDDMVFLFWYINPMNRQSPFRKPEAPIFYEFLDNDNLAKVSNDKDEIRITAMSIILGLNAWSITKLRTLAKGIGISGVNDMTDNVVKNELKSRAFNDPITFLNQAESREVAFSGKIQEAIDRHIIQLRTLNGMQRWYLGSNEIVPVTYGVDARKILDDHLSAKWYMYSDDINHALEGTSIATNLASPDNDQHFEETPTIETVSEVDSEVWDAYKELQKDVIKYQKILKYADVDVTNPGVHPLTRKAAEALKDEIALYKKGLEIENSK